MTASILETPGAGTQVTVNLPSTSSLWTLASKPAIETTFDRDGVTLGVKFQSTTGGFVNGIRFYKGFYNIGEHTVDLWTSTGTLLASGVSVGESLSGWQTVTFSSPVHINAGNDLCRLLSHQWLLVGNRQLFHVRPTPMGPSVSWRAAASMPIATNPAAISDQYLERQQNYWVDVVFTPDPNQSPTANDDYGFSVGKDGTLGDLVRRHCGQRHRSERRPADRHRQSATRRTEL